MSMLQCGRHAHSSNPVRLIDHYSLFSCARRVQVVSDAFLGKLPVARHRLVYDALKEELAAGLHALALKTKTPAEVERQTVSQQL